MDIQIAENGKPYNSASVHGTLTNVMIRSVKGNPGIGFANTGRAHSWRIIDSTFFENNVGVKLVDRAQHTQIIESSINGNYKQQLILGDGKAVLKDITVRDTNIEGRNVGTGELVLIDGVTPVNFDGVYFEGHRSVDAMDILTVNLPSIITMKGVYSNGGAENKPKASIVLRTETALSIEGATYINTQKVYEIGWRQGDPTWAKPEQSKVIVKNSRGPGIKRGLEINQGGASWDDGISLTQGKHTWDVVVGKEGILWFGYNRKAKVIFLPDGEVRTLK